MNLYVMFGTVLVLGLLAARKMVKAGKQRKREYQAWLLHVQKEFGTEDVAE
jgi:hypothetical protein